MKGDCIKMDVHMHRRLQKQKQLFKQLGIQLDALSIHQQQFRYKLRGYDPDEVDIFLDKIIRDYERFYANIADLIDKQSLKTSHSFVTPVQSTNDKMEKQQYKNIIQQLEHNLEQLKRQLYQERV